MALSISDIYKLFEQCSGVTTDSRNCPKDSMFIALKGASFNGNTFAADSIKKGCKFALVDEPQYADGVNVFLVDDCLRSLQALALEHRRRLGVPVLGITGTNGKTTTKELVASVLMKKFNLLFTQGNLNNHIGVPLTVLKMTSQHNFAVIEMGASHPGDIKELVDIAEPDFGLITNVGHAHIQGFGSFDGVIKTKGELYDFIRQHDGLVFRNLDNPHLFSISAGIKSCLYGKSEGADVTASVVSASPFLIVNYGGREIKTNLVGDYNFENVLAAITIGKYFGVSDDDIVDALQSYVPSNNRSQFKQTERNRLIIDAYNANPTSMTASLNNFFKMQDENKVVILGDMKELGQDSDMEHDNIVNLLCKFSPKSTYLVGECFKKAAKSGMSTFDDVDQLIEHVKVNPISNSTVLVKGSNSTKLIKVVDYL